MPNEEISEEENRFLEIIRSELNIKHRPLSIDRLNSLKEKYFESLEIGDVDEWNEEHNNL